MADLLTSVDDRLLAERFVATRRLTEALAAPLSAEDQTVQSMPDVSPTKWHRAHTSWFFETFLLVPSLPGYEVFHPDFGFLFNSYYEGVGPRYPRPQRGLVSRPGIVEIADYRRHVDAAMCLLLDRAPGAEAVELLDLVELGIQHEQQHQELLLMDIKHVLSRNPMLPAYAERAARAPGRAGPTSWTTHPGGTVPVGHTGDGFGFDNEFPRHLVHLEPFALADRTVTCGDWLEFVDDGGYRRPDLWLADGWATVLAEGWDAPLYWSDPGDAGAWREFTLAGDAPVDPLVPVSHVSYYEADAFARWAGARLPTEASGRWPPWHARQGDPRPTCSTSTPSTPDRCPDRPRPRSATCGSGRPRPTARIRGSSRRPGPSASTTASSWSTSTCCGAARA